MPPLGARKSLRSNQRGNFPRSRFSKRRIMSGANAGKIMVRFKPPGSKVFHTLAIVDTSIEAFNLINRMKDL